MAAKNNITGDLIQSRILTEAGRTNHDKIFVKKTARQWFTERVGSDISLYPEDSLKINDNELISLLEFERIMSQSNESLRLASKETYGSKNLFESAGADYSLFSEQN